jgi:uracil-DNA glycosylase family 4
MRSFFSPSSFVSKNRVSTIPKCGACGLYKHCQSPKMPATGRGKKKILIVAEAPGKREDIENTQLIGQAGQLLRKNLRSLGIDLNRDCWLTYAVICRPKDNQTPDATMIEACRPNLMKTIKKYDPNVIILLGKVAIDSLLGFVWKEDLGSMNQWAGWSIPCCEPNTWIVPTYHPSFLLRSNHKALDIIFKNHLKLAIKKSESKPWKSVPSYKDEVEVIMNPAQASKELRRMIKRGGDIAFDYETNCLKPDTDKAKIVTCSVCWNGKKTIAYPWQNEAIEMTDNLLKSSLGKIASNLKFEERWTRTILGHSVKNWKWDTMIAAHVLNNVPGITSIKFQSFVLLGTLPYDDHIKSFLKASDKSVSKLNRIHELDLKDLLLYNGLDSLLEYKVGMKQMKLLGEIL